MQVGTSYTNHQTLSPGSQRVVGYAKEFADFLVGVVQRARFQTEHFNNLMDRLVFKPD